MRSESPAYRADPVADGVISEILGPCVPSALALKATDWVHACADQWAHIEQVNRCIATWTSNADLQGWQPPAGIEPHVGVALQRYLATGLQLPDWADPARIHKAEETFMDYGALSCVLLFCSSLPECYVVPDLASVLHETGQLEKRTEYRIRSTAAMIFPVMMHGGLTLGSGGGVAQVLKVRLIHAMVRHLILHDSPEAALASPAHGNVASLDVKPQDMYQALFARGWVADDNGLPCNQQELAYTLLTFGYVFLRSMRRLGVGLTQQDEEAYLHAWNVVGHVLGIERGLMAETMADAEKLFTQFQTEGTARTLTPDPRPPLAQALINTMKDAIPWRLASAFPVLMTGYLCGRKTMKALGLTGPVAFASWAAFVLLMWLIRGFDWLVRLVVPTFSVSRFLSRVVGYQLLTKILMDQTRPLKLPDALLNQVGGMVDGWGTDPKAPKWVNTLEDRLTTPGGWATPASATATATEQVAR